MGGEFAQPGEWNSGVALPWARAEEPLARGIGKLLTALNQLQADFPMLSQWDGDHRGFEWLDCDDAENSVISFMRHGPASTVLVVLNFTPETRDNYRIPVPTAGSYREIFNSDNTGFGGSGKLNDQAIPSTALPCRGREHSLLLKLPPLAAMVLHKT